MKERLKQLANRIDALSVRERAIIFFGLIAVLFSLWDALLSTPLANKQKALIAEMNSKNSERLVLNTRLQELIESSQQDPDAENRKRLQLLRNKLSALESELAASTRNLVSPEEMPVLLESVLLQTRGLSLNSLKSLGVKPLVEQDEKQPSAKTPDVAAAENNLNANNISSAYKHGLRIEFDGDYFSTMAYLKKLEELEWGFFWDNFTLNVQGYPATGAAIEIFTLSLSKNWIGV